MPGMSLGIALVVVAGLLGLVLLAGLAVVGLAVGVSLGGMRGGYSKPSRLWFWRRGA